MMKALLSILTILLALNFTASAQTDIRIKKTSRMDIPNMPGGMKNPQTGEMMDFGKMPPTTVLVRGSRMLTETRPENQGTKIIMSTLRQCDLGRELSYTNKSKKYTASYFSTGQKQFGKGRPIDMSGGGGGTVTFTMAYTDTGERQQMLGYTARRVKSVMTTAPSADACDKRSMKLETDGWYIDLPTYSCPTFSMPEMPSAEGGRSCSDKMVFKVAGKPDNGFAIKETMTISTDGGQPIKLSSEATEITKTELDAQLFEVPPGYTEDTESAGKNGQGKNAGNDMYAAPPAPVKIAKTSKEKKDSKADNAVKTESVPMAQFPAELTASNTAPLGAKRKGVIRIGIAKPFIKMPDSKDDKTAPLQLSAAVRDALVESFKGETVEAVRLSTETPESEAKQMDCDYIFYANVTQKRGGSSFGKMFAMEALNIGLSMIPGVGFIAGTVGSVIIQQTMGKSAKAKDEFTFDYKVTDTAGAMLSQAVTKAKTKKDGEDVLNPQLKQASTTVLAEINKKRVL